MNCYENISSFFLEIGRNSSIEMGFCFYFVIRFSYFLFNGLSMGNVHGCYFRVDIFIVLSSILFFYVILYDDRLVVQNGVFFFWKGEYFYKDIVKVTLVWLGGMSNHYIQIFTEKGKSRRYFIDLVAPSDYQEIVNIVRGKGILVETVHLDEWVK